MSRNIKTWDLCSEDCFNCKYSDCIKPSYLMKSPHEVKRFRVGGRKDRRKKKEFMTDEEFESLFI